MAGDDDAGADDGNGGGGGGGFIHAEATEPSERTSQSIPLSSVVLPPGTLQLILINRWLKVLSFKLFLPIYGIIRSAATDHIAPATAPIKDQRQESAETRASGPSNTLSATKLSPLAAYRPASSLDHGHCQVRRFSPAPSSTSG